MVVEILMPSVGAGASHGKIINWCKNVGDEVVVGDILVEIETDKAVIEVEAFDDGVLQEILVQAGDDEVSVGQKIAILNTIEEIDGVSSGDDTSAKDVEENKLASDTTEEKDLSLKNNVQTPLDNNRSFASPSARRLARELDVDLNNVKGTGPKGRIVRVDIEKEANKLKLSNKVEVESSESEEKELLSQEGKLIAHSNMRKTIARRLLESKQNIPHFYLSASCEMDKVLKLRQQLNESTFLTQQLSINDILIFATARAVQEVPEINRQWTEKAVIENTSVDISVAVSTDAGLLTPIVHNVENKTLSEVALTTSKLIDKARSGRLQPKEYEGGSLTISNLGMYGVETFSAIINPPQSVIIAVGAVTAQPVVKNGEIAISQVMNITLSADHRLIDGAIAAQFLRILKEILESPYLLLI